MLASDGIFDKLKNQDVNSIVWNTIKEHQLDKNMSLHAICGKAADQILREAARLRTLDNISVVILGFQKLQDYLDNVRSQMDAREEESSSKRTQQDFRTKTQKVDTILKDIRG